MLSMRCTAHREENIRASHLLNNFLEKHNEVCCLFIIKLCVKSIKKLKQNKTLKIQ